MARDPRNHVVQLGWGTDYKVPGEGERRGPFAG